MKEGIHPEYKTTVIRCSCGATWETPLDQGQHQR